MKKYWIDYLELTPELDDDGYEVYQDGFEIITANNKEEAKAKFSSGNGVHMLHAEILSCEEY